MRKDEEEVRRGRDKRLREEVGERLDGERLKGRRKKGIEEQIG